jgi:hypothetical protein
VSLLLERMKIFENQFVTLDEIYRRENASKNSDRIALRVAITRLVKKGSIFSCGRGVYGFFSKPCYLPTQSPSVKKIAEVLNYNFPYLEFTFTDTSFLSEFMNLQPFSTIILIEVQAGAINPIISTLQKSNIMAFALQDYPNIERYIKNDILILFRPTKSSNPPSLTLEKIKFAGLEKILVDLVCDRTIFDQYQEHELENIYQNVTRKYVVNYSRLLKYAKARNRKKDCIDLLNVTEEYPKVRDLL